MTVSDNIQILEFKKKKNCLRYYYKKKVNVMLKNFANNKAAAVVPLE